MTSQYIHGSTPDEQRRLSLLNSLINDASLRALDLRGGERVLDVGSGLGQLSRAMARAVGAKGGAGTVVGVERDPEQRAEALRQAAADGEDGLVDFRAGDAVELPLAVDEWGSFDVVHARFVLEHVSDPAAVVAAMVRAARPGGRIVLEDDDHDLLRLWPDVPAFERVWRAYVRTYDRLGNDPYVGRRLVAMLAEAGAVPARNDMLFFGTCAGHRGFEAMLANLAGLVEGAPERIVEASGISPEELAEGLDALRLWARGDHPAMWYVTCWAEGRKPEAAADAGAAAPGRREPARRRPRAKHSSARFLVESAADLNSSLRLEEVFEKIAARIQDHIDCHLFCISLWNEESQLLEHSYSLRYGEHVPQPGGFALGAGLSGSAALSRQVLRVPDVRLDPRYVSVRYTDVDIRSELVVPLVVRDRLVGVLDLESTELDAFSAEDEQTVTALASHIATALENARLYEELRAKEARIAGDLETAKAIQTGLLPASLPRVSGIVLGAAISPARELSGDFYDCLPYGDGRLAIALGDVAGKSTPAALLASLTVGMLRGHALEHRPAPAAMLTHLNEQLYRHRVARRFVALAFAVYDPARARLAVANAGTPEPYLLRRGRVRNLEVGGVPAGGLADAVYSTVELDLEPGDVVLFCSDGLDDVENAAGEPFGSGALAQALRAAAESGEGAQVIADAVIRASTAHGAAPARHGDDRTVVVLVRGEESDESDRADRSDESDESEESDSGP